MLLKSNSIVTENNILIKANCEAGYRPTGITCYWSLKTGDPYMDATFKTDLTV